MQARTWKYLVAVGSLAVTAACADDQPANVTMPARPSLTVAAAGCDLNQMKTDAHAYFVSNQDPVYDLMQQLSSINQKGTFADFKTKAFEILSLVGSEVGDPAKVTTPAAGDAFVRDVLTCIGFSTDPGTFTASLGDNGLFGVPTGSAAVVSRGSPVYGVEPRTPTTTWTESVSSHAQFLAYGNPISFGFTPEVPAASTAAELKMIPAGLTFDPKVRGFFCQTTLDNALLQHESEILQLETANYCATIQSSSRDQGRGVFALVRHVTHWFSPQPVYATAAGGGSAGGLGGWSPIGAVSVNASTVKLAFVVQPSNGTINKDIKPPIVVSAVTANETPLDGVVVTLTVLNNQGTPIVVSGNVATTTAGGLATFEHLQTTKAGGYTITANGSINGGTTQTATSTLFNVQGKK